MIDHSAIREDVPLAGMTTYKVGGDARWFAEPRDLDELRSILAVTPRDTLIVLLGAGSNVVVSDRGIDGLVLRLAGEFAAIDLVPNGDVVAGGAARLAKLARMTTAAGREGLEFYIGIPGTVGGAVRMNAGGHGSETGAVLLDVVVLDLISGEVASRDTESLELGYRYSNLTDSDVVLQATFATSPGDVDELGSTLREITKWRKENQPGGTLNAGSVFKNPAGDSAGAIIDRCGLKGTSIGPLQVSRVHGNFIVAQSNATAQDVFSFVYEIQSRVEAETGISLEPEIRFLGSFESSREVL